MPKVVAEPAMTRREVVNGWERVVDRTVDLHIYNKIVPLIEVNRCNHTVTYSIIRALHLDRDFSHSLCQACRGRKVTA